MNNWFKVRCTNNKWVEELLTKWKYYKVLKYWYYTIEIIDDTWNKDLFSAKRFTTLEDKDGK